ncbi:MULTISPECIES: cyclodeaminase/cyclohydrolase family protein [unclassified Modestobacter]
MTRSAEVPEVDVQPLGDFLGQLAARLPAPGAGATAAIEAALAASLIGMVGRFTTGDEYAEHQELVSAVTEQADAVRTACLAAAAADEVAFTAVTEAYRLPRDTPEEQESRREAVHAAQVGAAQPPRDVIEAAAALVPLAEQLLPIANPNVVSDVAAATAAARAAAVTARLAVEVNLRGITDEDARADLGAAVDRVDELIRRADAVEATVRDRIGR